MSNKNTGNALLSFARSTVGDATTFEAALQRARSLAVEAAMAADDAPEPQPGTPPRAGAPRRADSGDPDDDDDTLRVGRGGTPSAPRKRPKAAEEPEGRNDRARTSISFSGPRSGEAGTAGVERDTKSAAPTSGARADKGKHRTKSDDTTVTENSAPVVDELSSVRKAMEVELALRTGKAKHNLMLTLKRSKDNAKKLAEAINNVSRAGTVQNLQALANALGYTYNRASWAAKFFARYVNSSTWKTDSPVLLAERSEALAKYFTSVGQAGERDAVATFRQIGVPLTDKVTGYPFTVNSDGTISMTKRSTPRYLPTYKITGVDKQLAEMLENWMVGKDPANLTAASARFLTAINAYTGALSAPSQANRMMKVLEQRAWAREHVQPYDWKAGNERYLKAMYSRHAETDLHNLPPIYQKAVAIAKHLRVDVNLLNEDASLGPPFINKTLASPGFNPEDFGRLVQKFIDDCDALNGDIKAVTALHPYAAQAELKAKKETTPYDKTGSVAELLANVSVEVYMVAASVSPKEQKTRSYYAVSKVAFAFAQLLASLAKNLGAPTKHVFEDIPRMTKKKVLLLGGFPFVRNTFHNLICMLCNIGAFKDSGIDYKILVYSDNLYILCILEKEMRIPVTQVSSFANSMPFTVEGNTAVIPAGTRVLVSMDASKFETAVIEEHAKAYYEAFANKFSLNNPARRYLKVVAGLVTNLTGIFGTGTGLKLDFEASGIPPTFDLNDSLMYQVAKAMSDTPQPDEAERVATAFGVKLETELVLVLPKAGAVPEVVPTPADSAVGMDFLGKDIWVDYYHHDEFGVPIFLPVLNVDRTARAFYISKGALTPEIKAGKMIALYLTGAFRFPEMVDIAREVIEKADPERMQGDDFLKNFSEEDAQLIKLAPHSSDLQFQTVVEVHTGDRLVPLMPVADLETYKGSWGDQYFAPEDASAVPTVHKFPQLVRLIKNHVSSFGMDVQSTLTWNKNLQITSVNVSRSAVKLIGQQLGFNLREERSKAMFKAALTKVVVTDPTLSTSWDNYQDEYERLQNQLRQDHLSSERLRNEFIEAMRRQVRRSGESINPATTGAEILARIQTQQDVDHSDEARVVNAEPVGRVTDGVDELGNDVTDDGLVVDVRVGKAKDTSGADVPFVIHKDVYWWKQRQVKVLHKLKPGKYAAEAARCLDTLKGLGLMMTRLNSLPAGPKPVPNEQCMELFRLVLPADVTSKPPFSRKDGATLFDIELNPDDAPAIMQRLANTRPNAVSSIKDRRELVMWCLMTGLKAAKFLAFVGPGGVDMTTGDYREGTYPSHSCIDWLIHAYVNRA